MTTVGTLRAGGARAGVELRSYVRDWQALLFTFALPLLLLVIFGAVFSGTVGHTGVPLRQALVCGIIASGIMSTSFTSITVGIAADREDGTLKRLAATPISPAGYVLGKIVQAFVVGVAETALLLAVGAAGYGLRLPDSPQRWLTLCWVCLLGIAACACSGVAYSRLTPGMRSAMPAVQIPYLVLQLISGVFFVFSQMPRALQYVAAVFPLKWMAQGIRSALLPDAFRSAEAAGGWEHGRVALVLAAWCVGAFAVAVLTFRWDRARGR